RGDPWGEPPRGLRMLEGQPGVLVDQPAGGHEVPRHAIGGQPGKRYEFRAYLPVQLVRRDVLGQLRAGRRGYPLLILVPPGPLVPVEAARLEPPRAAARPARSIGEPPGPVALQLTRAVTPRACRPVPPEPAR